MARKGCQTGCGAINFPSRADTRWGEQDLVGRSSVIQLGFQRQELTLRAESKSASQTARHPFDGRVGLTG